MAKAVCFMSTTKSDGREGRKSGSNREREKKPEKTTPSTLAIV